MLRIFVVDDEDIIREGIRNTLDSKSESYHLMGEAPDGEMALPQLQELKPDVLITDIRMPFMDGLDLSQQVRRTMPWIRIIILSGHDEFSYAQRAISLGVKDYLLKPITAQQLLDTLDKVALDIAREKEQIQKAQNTVANPDEKRILIEHFLNQLLSGGLSVSEAQNRAAELGIALSHFREYVVAYTDLSHFTRMQQRQILALAHQHLDAFPNLLVFSREGQRLVFLAASAEEEQAVDLMYGALQTFQHELSYYLQLQSPIGIGIKVKRLSELPAAWQAAKLAYTRHSNLNRSSILSLDQERIRNEEQQNNWDEFMRSGIDFASEQNLIEVLGYIESVNLDSFIDKYFRLSNDQDVQSMLYRYYLCMNLTVSIGKLLDIIGIDLASERSFANQPEKIFQLSESLESGKALARDLLDLYIKRRGESAYRYTQEIADARAFIQSHFNNAELSLQDVARHIGYSPNHFSTIFSQETGETFVGYLTRTRLEKACELLKNSDLKLREIAETVGYNEAHYFSYLFKKHVGLPPSEYRQQYFYDK